MADELQGPLELSTVYTEVAVGCTCMVDVTAPEGDQVYPYAEFAERVAVSPEQIVARETVTVGVGTTVTAATAELVQVPLDPVTVYVEFTNG